MEDYCKASRCPDIYEVVRDCIWDLVRGFNDTEDDEVMTLEEWSVFVRDTVHKHRTEAESQDLINVPRRATVGNHGRR